MNVRRFFPLAPSVILFCGAILIGNHVVAQDPFAGTDDPFTGTTENIETREAAIERIKMFNGLEEPSRRTSTSKADRTPMSVAELRQARALNRANQRRARIEYNLWMGHEPLRPKWNAVPMMTSRYPARKIYIPVYITH